MHKVDIPSLPSCATELVMLYILNRNANDFVLFLPQHSNDLRELCGVAAVRSSSHGNKASSAKLSASSEDLRRLCS